MRVRVLVEMDDGGRGVRAVNVIDAALHAYNEKLRLAEPSAEIDFEVLGVVSEEPRDRDPRQRAEYLAASRAEAAMGDWRPKKEPSTHDAAIRRRVLSEAENAAADALTQWFVQETLPEDDTSAVMDVRLAIRALRVEPESASDV